MIFDTVISFSQAAIAVFIMRMVRTSEFRQRIVVEKGWDELDKYASLSRMVFAFWIWRMEKFRKVKT